MSHRDYDDALPEGAAIAIAWAVALIAVVACGAIWLLRSL